MLEFTGPAWAAIQLMSMIAIALGFLTGIGWLFFASKLTDDSARYAKELYGAGFLLLTMAEILRTVEDFVITTDIIEYGENIVLIAGYFVLAWAAQQDMTVSRIYGFRSVPLKKEAMVYDGIKNLWVLKSAKKGTVKKNNQQARKKR